MTARRPVQPPTRPEGPLGDMLLTTPEVAAYLGVHLQTVNSWRHRKVALPWVVLPSFREDGRGFVRYRLADVVALVERNLVRVGREVGNRPGKLAWKAQPGQWISPGLERRRRADAERKRLKRVAEKERLATQG